MLLTSDRRILRISLSRWFQQFSLQIEQQWSEILLLFTILYSVVTVFHAVRRFWYDELFTYYTARLPDLHAIWASIKDGCDLNPPLLYIATRISHSVFGYGEIATRLPAMLGYLLMCFSLFIFVGRRSGRTYGMAAMVFPRCNRDVVPQTRTSVLGRHVFLELAR